MKSIVISVLMLSMALFFVSCENEGQLTQSTSDVEKQILDKRYKSEDITISGDLTGVPETQRVVGCCPNAGPNPEYTLTLSNEVFPSGIAGIPLEGNMFMSPFGRNMPWDYKFQFWWGGEDEYFLEIRGGLHEKDKKTRITTVTFTSESMLIIDPDDDSSYVDVTFTIIRDPLKRGH